MFWHSSHQLDSCWILCVLRKEKMFKFSVSIGDFSDSVSSFEFPSQQVRCRKFFWFPIDTFGALSCRYLVHFARLERNSRTHTPNIHSSFSPFPFPVPRISLFSFTSIHKHSHARSHIDTHKTKHSHHYTHTHTHVKISSNKLKTEHSNWAIFIFITFYISFINRRKNNSLQPAFAFTYIIYLKFYLLQLIYFNWNRNTWPSPKTICEIYKFILDVIRNAEEIRDSVSWWWCLMMMGTQQLFLLILFCFIWYSVKLSVNRWSIKYFIVGDGLAVIWFSFCSTF